MENLTTEKFEEIIKAVAEMRRLQISYKQHRDKKTLQWAIEAAKRVDKYLEEFANPKLF